MIVISGLDGYEDYTGKTMYIPERFEGPVIAIGDERHFPENREFETDTGGTSCQMAIANLLFFVPLVVHEFSHAFVAAAVGALPKAFVAGNLGRASGYVIPGETDSRWKSELITASPILFNAPIGFALVYTGLVTRPLSAGADSILLLYGFVFVLTGLPDQLTYGILDRVTGSVGTDPQ
ncbi:hypothetical protein ACFQL4_24655 [Halosimplex aquaticum]